jgi:hypothetical protein
VLASRPRSVSRSGGITEESIVAFAETALATVEVEDKRWAREKGRIFVGRL